MRVSIDKIKNINENKKRLDDLLVQSLSGVSSKESYEEIHNYFKERTMDADDLKKYRDKKNRVFNADDPEQNKYAANVLMSFFKAGVK